jgi:NADH-quinone oxidoreductase subunit H
MSFFADPITFISNWLNSLLTNWGVPPGWAQFILFILGAGALSLGAMVFTIFLIWLERKLGGRFQDRIGPNRVGPWGIFQTIADMLKIFTKEYITPWGSDPVLFNLAPVLAMAAVLAVWAVIPLSSTVYGSNIHIGVLYILAVGALGELGVILAGFASNNKYALLGGFRVVAMLISYEVPMALTLLVPVMLTGSMGLNDITSAQRVWFIWQAPVAALVFFIASIAENSRAPFDLIEADSEIVAGFNIEYSGLKFGMFYVADFLHAFTAALIFASVFLGGWRGPGAELYPALGFLYLLIKTAIVYFITISIRFSLPRLRVDQVMAFNWKYLTPLALVSLLVTALVDKSLPAGQGWLRLGGLLLANLVIFVVADRLVSIYHRRKNQERRVVSGPRPIAVTLREKPAEPVEVES